MSEADREKWDRRYAERGDDPPRAPSAFLEDALALIRPGRALVAACGTGRNALRLAEAGFTVEAVDIAEAAIARAAEAGARRGLDVAWSVADLDAYQFEPERYDLVTMVRYLNRAAWPRVVRALAPNGWLLIEHHLATSAPVRGPSSPEFRLAPQELLLAFADLRIVHYSERLEPSDRDDDLVCLARLLACRGTPGW